MQNANIIANHFVNAWKNRYFYDANMRWSFVLVRLFDKIQFHQLSCLYVGSENIDFIQKKKTFKNLWLLICHRCIRRWPNIPPPKWFYLANQVKCNQIRLMLNKFPHFTTPNHVGTSIGFKNIASKIAYDLRLWLGANDPPSKDALYELNDSTTTQSDNENECEPGTKSPNKGRWCVKYGLTVEYACASYVNNRWFTV